MVGAKAVLIRGPSGAGKSRLALDLIQAATQGALPFARLVATTASSRSAQRPAAGAAGQELAGLIEIHGLGIRHLPYEPVAAAGLVVDLAAADADRLPAPEAATAMIAGITLPRLAVAPGMAALPLVLAALCTTRAPD